MQQYDVMTDRLQVPNLTDKVKLTAEGEMLRFWSSCDCKGQGT